MRVLTCSWGLEDPTTTFSEAMSNAYEEDLVIMVASGNEAGGMNSWPYPAANIDFTQAVAHVLCDSTRREYIQGNFIDITAPGGLHIETTEYDGGTDRCFGGTSASSPIAAGVASLILARCPDLTNDDVYAIMRSTAQDIGVGGYDILYGSGLVRADEAIALLDAADCEIHVSSVSKGSVTLVDSTTIVLSNIPSMPGLGRTSWAKVYKVEGTATITPGQDKEVAAYWTRNRSCETVRNPEDLYRLDYDEGWLLYPYFDGARLGTWANIEHSSGTSYTVYGFVYHVYDDSGQGTDFGWYPFNPNLPSQNPPFSVAYLEVDAAKRPPAEDVDLTGAPRVHMTSSILELSLAKPSTVEISVYDVAGRLAANLGARRLGTGKHSLDIAAQLRERAISSGVYLARVAVADAVYSGKIVVLR